VGRKEGDTNEVPQGTSLGGCLTLRVDLAKWRPK